MNIVLLPMTWHVIYPEKSFHEFHVMKFTDIDLWRWLVKIQLKFNYRKAFKIDAVMWLREKDFSAT